MSIDRLTAAARQPAAATAFLFEAGTPAVPLWLALDPRDGAACAAEAALRLGELEPLLSALDAWLGDALDWRWYPAEAPAMPRVAGAVARWADAGIGTRLGLPWAVLRRLPAPPAALAAGLRWEPVPAICVLSTLELASNEQAGLKPGGVLLLPASFEDPWATTLRAEDEAPGQGLVVTLDRPDRPVWQRAATGKVPQAAWEVRCGLSAPLCPSLLAGWRDLGDWRESAAELDLRTGASLWQLPPDESPRRHATGCLLPWGQGHGLWLSPP